MKVFRSALLWAALVTSATLVSCHAQLTELLIAAIEDDFSPVIVVQTPVSGETYYSTINVTGYINDDSLGSGDNKGLLRSLSITAGTDLDHKGRIIIDSNGGYEHDPAFGTIGTIGTAEFPDPDRFFHYNPSDRSFDIWVTTSDLGFPPQTLYLVIEAEDFNGNESSEIVQLLRSEGPYIELSQPAVDETYYTKEGSITIRGAVGDSYQRQGEADEVASIRLDILALGISTEVDTSSGDAFESLFPRTGTLDYDYTIDAQGQFQCIVDLISSDDGITSLTINVVATDKNGNTSTASHAMTQIPDAAGPVVTFTTPYTSGTYYYSIKPEASALLYEKGASKTPLSSLTCTGWVYSLVSSRWVATAEMVLSSGAYSNTINIKNHGGTIVYLPPIYPKDYYQYNITYSGATFRDFGGQGAELKLTAIDNTADSNISEYTWQIREDSNGPIFTPGSITATPSGTFVGPSHTISFNFHLADGSFETGLKPNTLSGNVGGNLPIAAYLSDDGSGNYTVTDLPLTTANQSTGNLDIDITASDEIGNESSLVESDFTTINFISGVPTLTAISIAADASPTDAAKPNDDVTLTITSDHFLEPTDLDVTIAGAAATVNEAAISKTLTATATIPGGYATDPVEFEITGFMNAVGTAGVVPLDNADITDGSSVKLYTTGPTLTVDVISSEHSGDEYVRSFEDVTLTVSSNQLLKQAPTVKIGDRDTTETLAGDSLSFTAAVTRIDDPEGQIDVDYSNIENVVGLTTTAYSETISAWFYPGLPTLTLTATPMTLEKGAGPPPNTGADPEEGDIIVLEFTVADSRVLQSDPTVAFKSDTTALTPVTKDGGTAPPAYRFTHTVTAADLTLADPIAWTVDFTDAAGNVGVQVSDTSTIDLTP